VRVGQGRVQPQQHLELFNGLIRALELQEAQPQRVARRRIIGGDLHGALQQPQRLVWSSLLLEPERRDVQYERMFESPRESACGQLPRLRMVAAACGLVDRLQGFMVGIWSTGHGRPNGGDRLSRPHSMQILDHIIELHPVAPVHFERL